MVLYAVLPLERAHSPRISTLDSHYDRKLPTCIDDQPTLSTTQNGGPLIDHIMDVQTTPPRTQPTNLPAVTAIQGTPHNRGSSSRSHRDDTNGIMVEPQRVCEDYDDYIREDLSKHRVYISFENGLKTLLHVPEDWRSSRHEYSRIISRIREDTKYHEYRNTYLGICKDVGAIEPSLYEPQATLYNHTISLINQFCKPRNRKQGNNLLHFQKNHPKYIAQGIFTGLNPDLTAKFEPLKDRKPLVWPMIVHIEETKDSDVALDRGRDGPRARKPGEEDPLSEHRTPCRKTLKSSASQTDPVPDKKRKNESTGFIANKVPRTSKTPTVSASSTARSTTALPENQKTAGARLQCARYLMEMLELSILRSHAFLTLVDRDHLQLMYADRSAIVTTSIIDLTTPEGETMFLAMLIAFHRLTPGQWGFLPLVDNSFTTKPSGDAAYHRNKNSATSKQDCLKNLTLHLQKKIGKSPLCLTLQEILYHQPGIIGRGTCVVGALCEDIKEWEGRELVVKVSWPSKTRPSEISLLDRARRKGEELLAKRQARRDVLEEEIERLRERGEFDEATAKSQEAKHLVEESGTHWALNHLPNILHSEDFVFDPEGEPMPQAKLALFLSKAEFINGTFNYELRVLRVSVQEKLHKITTLPTLLDYAQAFYDIFICHRWLYDCPRILHRDISSGNIMYRIIGGKIYGVLNDLDLSSLRESLDQGVQMSLQRTGTPPYMAIELLQDVCANTRLVRHLYRHDLESFAYVLLILCSRNKFNPSTSSIERLTQAPFNGWFDPELSWHNLAVNKYKYLLGNLPLSMDIHPSFQGFIPWLKTLLFAFRNGFTAQINWQVDMDNFNEQLQEGSSAKVEEEHNPRLWQTLDGGQPVSQKALKPAPFREGTLGGQVKYLKVLHSLSTFAGKSLVYREFDVRREEYTTDDDIVYS